VRGTISYPVEWILDTNYDPGACRRNSGAYETISSSDDKAVSREQDRQEVGMLVLSRRQSQQIVIGRDIRITVVKVERNHVRLGIDAPQGVIVLREELAGRQRENEGHAQAQADRPRVRSV